MVQRMVIRADRRHGNENWSDRRRRATIEGGFQEALASEVVSWCRVLGSAHAVAARPLIGWRQLAGRSTRPLALRQLVDALAARAPVHHSHGSAVRRPLLEPLVACGGGIAPVSAMGENGEIQSMLASILH